MSKRINSQEILANIKDFVLSDLASENISPPSVAKAAGISVESEVADCAKRYPSYEAMKKVLSLPLYNFGILTGPSNSTPN